MKTMSVILLLLSTSAFAQSDLARNYREIIEKKWIDSSPLDPTNLGNALLIGRCFLQDSQQPIVSAILVNQKKQDGGPLGQSTDLISYGILIEGNGGIETETYDSAYLKYSSGLNEITEFKNEYYLSGMRFRKNLADGYVYTANLSEYGFGNLCYFYQKN